MEFVRFVLLTFTVYNSLIVNAGMVCKQDELGSETTIICSSAIEPFCCVDNGKMSCCSESEFHRKENGSGSLGLLAVFLALSLITGVFISFSWFCIKKRLLIAQEMKMKNEAKCASV